MTISRLKRIELITTIVITLLLIPYALIAGWFVGSEYQLGFWQVRSVRYIFDFAPLIYGLAALALAPVILLIVRKITQKNVAALTIFLASLLSTILLFAAPPTLFLLILFSHLLLGIELPLKVHLGLSIIMGIIFSLVFSLLGRAYVGFRNQVIQSNKDLR